MIELRGLTVRYGDTVAVDDVSLDLPTGAIYGLLGRNGSGKTSLLSALASHRRPTRGDVVVDGVEAFENPAVMRATCFVGDAVDVLGQERVCQALALAKWLRPTWDDDYASKLLEIFAIDRRKRVQSLSRGQKSALGAVVGLASRTPLTILDEVYLGMDAVARTTFYRELLADYLAHPRTIILSTHLIDEVADLFERVIVIDRGRILLHEEADGLRGRGATVTGPAAAVEAFTAGRTVLASQSLGGTRADTVYGRLEASEVARAEAAGLSIGPVGLQELFIHLTSAAEVPDERR
ncbi:ABC transporter ATP-binding protein [Actinoplanes sp. NPDC051411]|uniref:ABC transporter ATP-binding protein n=1 Tax=Actinoplanes sp. NPDC051411 TaxID=3155522 RepID=UPI0034169082